MAGITEKNPQILRLLEIVQEQAVAAVSSGLPFRIRFDDLSGSGGRLHDWSRPAVSYKELLAKIGAKI